MEGIGEAIGGRGSYSDIGEGNLSVYIRNACWPRRGEWCFDSPPSNLTSASCLPSSCMDAGGEALFSFFFLSWYYSVWPHKRPQVACENRRPSKRVFVSGHVSRDLLTAQRSFNNQARYISLCCPHLRHSPLPCSFHHRLQVSITHINIKFQPWYVYIHLVLNAPCIDQNSVVWKGKSVRRSSCTSSVAFSHLTPLQWKVCFRKGWR